MRLHLFAFFFGRGLRIAKSLRRVRCELLFDDLEVCLARLDELPQLGVSPRHEQQMRRGVHQGLGLDEQVDRVFEAALVEGLRALGGQRAGAGALLVALR